MKSILKNLQVQKWLFLPFWRLWIWLIWWNSAFKKCKNVSTSNFKAYKCVKLAYIALLVSSNLISHKIWMTEKSWNFHACIVGNTEKKKTQNKTKKTDSPRQSEVEVHHIGTKVPGVFCLFDPFRRDNGRAWKKRRRDLVAEEKPSMTDDRPLF